MASHPEPGRVGRLALTLRLQAEAPRELTLDTHLCQVALPPGEGEHVCALILTQLRPAAEVAWALEGLAAYLRAQGWPPRLDAVLLHALGLPSAEVLHA